LFAICADELAVGDNGELGPLDVQVNKPDELAERISGLDILNTLTQIKEHSIRVFKEVLTSLRYGAGISTKLASQVAVEFAVGSAKSLYEQIDQTRLSEVNRAMQIAMEYGTRLNEYGQNLKNESMRKLLLEYPDHSFVIDRKEARDLFHRVSPLTDVEVSIYNKYVSNLFDPDNFFGPEYLSDDGGGDSNVRHSYKASE